MSSDVRQLVSACLAEDPDAMQRLVDRFRDRVVRLCFRLLGQWQDAEDAAQETFLRVARNLHKWDSRREFEPWLFAIAANRCRSLIARRRRSGVIEPLGDHQAIDHRVADDIRSDALFEEMNRALATLPPEWCLAFRMFHHQGLAYRQIADRLDRPVGTVKTWVHRCRIEMLSQLARRGVLPE